MFCDLNELLPKNHNRYDLKKDDFQFDQMKAAVDKRHLELVKRQAIFH